jgi:hypothetical protein
MAVLCLAVPASAAAHTTNSGGAGMPERPELSDARCSDGKLSCPEGGTLRLKGEYLQTVRTVIFLGGRGHQDDRRVKPAARSPHRVVVTIPAAAPSGRVRVVAGHGAVSAVGPRVRIVAPPKPAAPPSAAVQAPPGADGIFPIQGKYQWGTDTNHFGGGRGHQGEDVFAKCGTPLVAAVAGQVAISKYHDAAGNYVVINTADGTSHVYMHLREPSPVKKGQRIGAGQAIGAVGDTGRATGCHLHFELWTAPGWYEGGEPIDPLPTLQRWARGAKAARS